MTAYIFTLILSLLVLNLHIVSVEMLDRDKNVFMNVEDFKTIKRSESFSKISQAYSFINEENDKSSYLGFGDEAMFFKEVDDTWELAHLAENIYLAEEGEKTTFDASLLGVTSPFFPFLVCMSTISESVKKSGFNRLKLLAERFGNIDSEDVLNTTIYTETEYLLAAQRWSDFGLDNYTTAGTNSAVYPMYNADERSCFAFRSLASEAEKTATYSYGKGSQAVEESDNAMHGEEFLVIPFTDSMKLEQGILEDIERIFNEFNNDKAMSANISSNLHSFTERTHEIKLSIQLSPGAGDGTIETSNKLAEDVTDTARNLASQYYRQDNIFGGGTRHLRRNYEKTANSSTDSRENVKRTSLLRRLLERNYEAGVYYSENNMSRRGLMEQYDDSSTKGICENILTPMDFESYFLGNAFDLTIDVTAKLNSDFHQEQDIHKCYLLFLKALTHQPDVLSVAMIPKFQLFNDDVSQIIQGGTENDPNPFHDMGYTGKGQVVAVSDAGLNMDSCYFKSNSALPKNGKIRKNQRKVIQYIIADKADHKPTGSHGSHVTGTIAGVRSYDWKNPSANDKGNGVAPGAKISFMDIGSGTGLFPPSNLKILIEPPKAAGARIFSASWGDNYKLGSYSYYSNRFDEYLYLNQDLFITFASGNFGEKGIAYPSTAKNVVCVGASYTDNVTLAHFSSRGEVEGNRIKPDIIAPGSPVYSASGTSSCKLIKSSGTSMATPVISGSVSIIRQYLQEHNMTMPSGSLLRSILINGGKKLDTGVPYDNNQGFGLINLKSSLPLPTHNLISLFCQNLETVKEGCTNEFEIQIEKNETNCNTALSVTLVYTDPPGPSIMNDLDLEVERKDDGRIFYPNPIVGKGTFKDKLNNVERVRVRNQEQKHEDEFIIRITGTNMIQSAIKYSVAVTGCFKVSQNITDFNNTLFIASEEI